MHPLPRTRPALAATLTSLAFLAASPVAVAAVPGTVPIEGLLSAASGGPVADGSYKLSFALYGVPKGGQASWTEVALAVPVKAGRFHHVLGVNKPLGPALQKLAPQAWLGVTVGADPELARVPLRSVPFAMVAGGLSCSGCVGASQLAKGAVGAAHLDFTWAGSKTKGGPAELALDLKCTGCVGLSEIAWTGDVDIGGAALKAKKVIAGDLSAGTVVAAAFLGDGSKLTGIKVPSGQCKGKGEVVRGIASDGSLLCVPAVGPDDLPPDGLAAISNGTLDNRFTHTFKGAGTPLPIPDDDPIGAVSVLNVPDVGLIKTLKVSASLTSSDISQLTLTLYDPSNAVYVLFDKNGKGKALSASWPTPSKPVSGDLGALVGKNPKGKWQLKVTDKGKTTGKSDGALSSWGIEVVTVSGQKVQAKGKLIAVGGLDLASVPVQGLRLENAKAAPVKCDAAALGYVYVDTAESKLMFCTGKVWVALHDFGLGATPQSAGESCKALLALGATKDGAYWIKHKGAAVRTWCAQSLKGGGWTMAFKYSTGNALNNVSAMANAKLNAGDATLLGPQKSPKILSLALMDLSGAKELLAVVYKAGAPVYTIGFKLVSGNLASTWNKARFIQALSSVHIASYDANLITVKMSSCNRHFYVTRSHGGCPNDFGSLTVSTSGGFCCGWEKNHTIHYWAGPGDWQNYYKVKKDGEVLALYVR